ncbi:MAG TPA: hypothetical protein VJM32_00435 [Candidatus Saccharimonadales bacterium]|nr:hypothetical protein [Candidatus Saccharimonadales bacterium]
MEFKGGQTNNAPANNGGTTAAPRFAGNGGGNMSLDNSNNKKMIMAALVVVAILVVAFLAFWGWKQMAGGASGFVKGNQYQALFLTNGQVYFGKISNVDDKYVKLSDIYYLQVQQTVQPAQQNQQNNSPQVSLAKLGSELHGPEDTMLVNRDQVLFWENIKDDGKVVQAIKDNANK